MDDQGRDKDDATVAKVYVDRDRSAYRDILSSETADRLFAAADGKPAVEAAVCRLMLNWRAATYLVTVHSTWPNASLDAARLEMIRSDHQVLSFGELFVNVLSQKVPEIVADPSIRKKLRELGIEAAASYADKLRDLSFDDLVESHWQQLISEPVAAMYIWYSQASAFIMYLAAYESFLLAIAQVVDPGFDGRLGDRDLHKKLAACFGEKTASRLWSGGRVAIAREVRHAVVHNASYETKRLGKLKHGMMVIDGLLSITVDDNRSLMKHLVSLVDEQLKAVNDSTTR